MRAIAEIANTRWNGISELWLDPLGDQAVRSPCTVSVETDVVRYTWSHENTEHKGSITLQESGADFADTFHQPDPMHCRALSGALGLFQVQGAYGPQADWGWRIGLCVRTPSDELVLQMTNITPWGEEVRAVRMTCQREI